MQAESRTSRQANAELLNLSQATPQRGRDSELTNAVESRLLRNQSNSKMSGNAGTVTPSAHTTLSGLKRKDEPEMKS